MTRETVSPNNQELQLVLERLQELQQHPEKRPANLVDVWSDMHRLAEAQYSPAQEFFQVGLNDLDWEWREYCVSCLGFHFALSAHDTVVEKFRELLQTDPASHVRIAAAGALGNHAQVSDGALRMALELDPDYLVRLSAFEALLKLAGVNYVARHDASQRVESGEIEPTWDSLNKIVKATRSGSSK